MNRIILTLLIFGLALASVNMVSAQDSFKFGGLLYFDYAYTLQDEDPDAEGDNGFGYRRLYLTGDYTINESFSARARLEASDGSTTAQGRPAPFIKDMYLQWKNAFAEGHHIVFGVTSPPVKGLAEKVWAFRSIEKTITDRLKIASSRDMGILFKGNVVPSGSVKYGLMFANNSSVSREEDRHKRIYGQIEFNSSGLVGAVGGDYASQASGDGITTGNAFLAYTTDAFTLGAEGFVSSRDAGSQTVSTSGVGTFARATVTPSVELVGRFDYTMFDASDISQILVLGGVSFMPTKKVRFIPNVGLIKSSEEDTGTLTGRITLHADF